jgi:hypothetical protein
MTNSLREIDCPLSFISQPGERIYREFVYPSLEHSVDYYRSTGYFTVGALASAAKGVEALMKAGGNMRLIIGVHDIDRLLLEAIELGQREAKSLLDVYEQRFLAEASLISDELTKRELRVLAWLMAAGRIEVKFAAPRSRGGIFHSKFFLFRDAEGNQIFALGSINETEASSFNIEDVSLIRSWTTEEFSQYEAVLVEMWEGRHPPVLTIDITRELVHKLLNAVGDDPAQRKIFEDEYGVKSLGNVLELLRQSPDFSLLNSTNVMPYPHQERVFSQALGRWPIRVMLADEVGLGKTIEIGLILSTLAKTSPIDICVLAPKGLLTQWQEELSSRFGLNFAIWESTSSSFHFFDKSVKRGRFDQWKSLGVAGILVSAQWARGHGDQITAALPDVLVLDEAHAARLHDDGKALRPTKLLKLMDQIAGHIPHVILATATPLQAKESEFWALLRILDLGPAWSDYRDYQLSLQYMGDVSFELSSLDDGRVVATLLHEAATRYGFSPAVANESELEAMSAFIKLFEQDAVDAAIFVQANQDLCRRLLVLWHPANHLVIRNTKSALSKYGYKFPERHFHAPELRMEGSLQSFERMIEKYLREDYGTVEKALDPKKFQAMGFVAIGYMQRMVSSLYSCQQTIGRRLDRISNLRDALEAPTTNLSTITYQEDIDDDFELDDEFDSFSVKSIARSSINNVRAACQLEELALSGILNRLSQLEGGPVAGDPKMQALLGYLERRDFRPTLVFSRFTDTLDAAISLFQNINEQAGEGFGVYTGSESYAIRLGIKTDHSKSELKQLLDQGEITVLFCSDAASEGLNLQAARNLINIDVPWNPARLEQRIGRIARLGQIADVVNIVNLWYPDSVESRMYSRLLQRVDLFQMAVGEFPDIVASSIKKSLVGEFGKSEIEQSLMDLETMRLSSQVSALNKVFECQPTGGPLTRQSEQLRKRATEVLQSAGLVPDSANYDPTCSLFGADEGQFLSKVIHRTDALQSPIFALLSKGHIVGFQIVIDGTPFLLSLQDAAGIISELLGHSGLSRNEVTGIRIGGSTIDFLMASNTASSFPLRPIFAPLHYACEVSSGAAPSFGEPIELVLIGHH